MAIRVVELFAGVGGFRIGLEGFPRRSDSPYEVVWSNQWEPGTRVQHASRVYEARWPNSNHSNKDISTVPISEIPDHDLLVGGFPCQDYSVASTLKNSGGLIGKKGVLWWQIHRILKEKGNKAPKFLFLENVDRLLKSPAKQRGRDFAVMLSSLNKLGYAVEWRVINAADYGMPQRRRRIFLIGYRQGAAAYGELNRMREAERWILEKGLFAKVFPVAPDGSCRSERLNADLAELSEEFNRVGEKSPFENSGLMIEGTYHTIRTKAIYDGPTATLGDVMVPIEEIPEEFMIDGSELDRWNYEKGAKKERKYNKAGDFWYNYAEGAMAFPDASDRPSRTVITAEGGRTASRSTHVVKQNGRYRRLIPLELERLNMFPDNHTAIDGIRDAKRAFLMGNALVVGVVEKIGRQLAEEHNG